MRRGYRIWLVSMAVVLACCQSRHADGKPAGRYARTITAGDLKKYVYTIAADSMQGRETGSEGQRKAGRYLISVYKALHIPAAAGAPDYYQHIPAAFLNAAHDDHLPGSENICALIRGSEKPDEVVVLSAHYDHIGVKNGQVYNGADDDGTGTATLLAVAKAMSVAAQEGHRPARSVLFLHVTGEEYGLHGSRYYAENPLYPLQNTVADVNIDMIGRRDSVHATSSRYIYVIGSGKLSGDLYRAVREANQESSRLNLDYTYDDARDPNRFYYRSDHYNFARRGIPSVFLFSGVHEDYHQPGDDPEKIEYDALRERARMAFTLVWKLANAPGRPVVDRKDQ